MLVHHFEYLAKDTWETLRDATALHIAQGEETITDNLLLYLARQHLPNLRVIKTPKSLESEKGTDWEWWIGNSHTGFVRYAVQAKKLDGTTYRYSKLNHLVGKAPHQESQHVVLKKYATANDAIPLYALYNNIELSDYTHFWQCPLPQEVEQLGITVTPLKNVETAITTWGGRTFQSLHKHSDTIPLRCLVRCPNTVPRKDSKGAFHLEKFGTPIRLFNVDEVPFLRSQTDSVLESFPSNIYSTDLGIYPKKILVVTRES